MRKTVLMLATTAAMIEQFNKSNIEILRSMGYQVHVAGNFDIGNPISNEKIENFKLWINNNGMKWFNIPATRNPFDIKSNGESIRIVIDLINKFHYDFIHCHTPIGSVIARIAAHMTRTKIMYTAHGFHFYTGAPFINWLIYYPVEKFLSRWTDVLITINKEDYERAKAHFHANKIEYVPGVGIDTMKFNQKIGDRSQKREELGIKDSEFALLSVGELIPRKNHTAVLDALAELKRRDELDSIQYLICGQGQLDNELKEKTKRLGIANHVRFLGYRSDISEICTACDLFIFPSLQEGLPVALMEALACGLPVICSNIRGNTEIVENQKNGMIVDAKAMSIADAIVKLKKDKAIRDQLSYNAIVSVRHYDLSLVKDQMHRFYNTIRNEDNIRRGGYEHLLRTIQCQKLKIEYRIPFDKTVLLSVGEVNKNKNHRIVIEALPELPDCYYVICGRGTLIEKHRKLAERLGVSDRLVMTGYRTDVEDFYHMADIFVFPSIREGLPVALMEAMAAGLPCVVARNRGTNELIRDESAFFPVNNYHRLAEAIQLCKRGYSYKGVVENQNTISGFGVSVVQQVMHNTYQKMEDTIR